MQKFDHIGLIYGIIRTHKRVLVRQGKRAIMVQTIEVLLYKRTGDGPSQEEENRTRQATTLKNDFLKI